MRHIVNPQYRWLQLILVGAYALAALSQIVWTIIDPSTVLRLFLTVPFAFLAFSLYRVAPWSYVVVGSINLFGVLGLLNQAASLSTLGFVILVLAAGAAWCAFFLRGQLLQPVSNENP